MSAAIPHRFQKIIVTGWIATSHGGDISRHADARVEHPECPDGFPRVWKHAESVPPGAVPLKVRVTVERLAEGQTS